jgi:3',5'-nucleoside bisphosphate phosphatase
MEPIFDLQSHSLYSDGELPPAAVVAAAAAAGVELLALTDHDSIAGIEEALQAAPAAGLEVIPATELSAVDEEYEELHILGYLLDHRDAALAATLEDLRADRERRVLEMADLLRGTGFQFDDGELKRRSAAGDPLGRPHLAHAILDHPANAERLKAEGITGLRELFPLYLVPGVPTYVARTRPTVGEAIELIHAAGGVAVWAHPFWDVKDPATVRSMLDPRPRAGRPAVRRGRRARAADDRLLGLPRLRAQDLRRLSRVRALRARAQSRAAGVRARERRASRGPLAGGR